MTDLDKLIDAVERGGLDDVNSALGRIFSEDHNVPWQLVSDANSAYRGSLDAAKALHDALLPERAVAEFRYIKRYSDESYVTVSMPDGYRPHGRAENPARAWLLCMLKAYRSQVQG